MRRDHLSSSEAALVVLQYQVLHEGSGTRAVDLEGGGSQGARLREPWLWGWCANVLGGLDATRRRMYAGWIPEVELLDVWQAEEIRRTERAVAALSRRLQERIESLEREFSRTDARLRARRLELRQRINDLRTEHAGNERERRTWGRLRTNMSRTDAYERELVVLCEQLDLRWVRPLDL